MFRSSFFEEKQMAPTLTTKNELLSARPLTPRDRCTPGFRFGLLILVECLLILFAAKAPAADAPGDSTSLKLIPADAAVYSACLRNREIFDAVISSKAAKKFTEMPVYAQMRERFNKDVALAFMNPANMILLNLTVEMLSEEIFLYGGQRWSELIRVFQEVNRARQLATMVAVIEAIEAGPGNVDLDRYQQAAVFRALKNNMDRLRVPETVIGFKIKDKEAARSQINRLEKLLNEQMEDIEGLRGRLRREVVGDEEFLTLKIDGSLVPWHRVPWEDFEEEEGEYDELVEKLQAMEAVLSVGLLDEYLVLSVGETNEHLSRLGHGDLLVDRREFEPLRRHADRRLSAISYASAEIVAASSLTEEDADGLGAIVEALLPEDLDENLRKRIQADTVEFGEDLKQSIAEPGAALTLAYITDSGFEGYSYSWTQHLGLDGSQPLTLLDHVGGDPILFLLARAPCSVRDYDTLAKWVTKLHDYVEQFAVAEMDESQRARFEQVKRKMVPQLARLDKANRNMLLPALRDGQIGFVVDAKTKSKQWCASMPKSQVPLPMLELALLAGVSDAELLKRGIAEYLDAIDEVLGLMHEMAPNQIPEWELPRVETRELGAVTAHCLPLPKQWELDKKLTPNAGLSNDVAVVSVTPRHTRRLLTETPLTVGGSPLANPKRPLAMAASLNFAALVDALQPWVDFAFDQAMKDWDPENDSFPLPSVREQVRTAMQILRCFRGVTSASYFENKALVTHFQWRFEDLE
jgi:hypothetical protein